MVTILIHVSYIKKIIFMQVIEYNINRKISDARQTKIFQNVIITNKQKKKPVFAFYNTKISTVLEL